MKTYRVQVEGPAHKGQVDVQAGSPRVAINQALAHNAALFSQPRAGKGWPYTRDAQLNVGDLLIVKIRRLP
ncbi:hypothetical protein LCGC14_2563700 [marine sediment metagenome]|uniref:Uncharacterized protein n=1 Tax=marine sediment metagenome TaxID=412755 RepID=A0A0F9DC48_9ZZZZ